MELSFPNYILEALALKRADNIIEDIQTLIDRFDPTILKADEALKFILDDKDTFDTDNFAIINLHGEQINIFTKALEHDNQKRK